LQGSRLTAGVTGKGGTWRKKPPDAESASWGRFPESAGNAPHLSGARGVGQRWLKVFQGFSKVFALLLVVLDELLRIQIA